MHARTGSSSSSTVQAPHTPCSHPSVGAGQQQGAPAGSRPGGCAPRPRAVTGAAVDDEVVVIAPASPRAGARRTRCRCHGSTAGCRRCQRLGAARPSIGGGVLLSAAGAGRPWRRCTTRRVSPSTAGRRPSPGRTRPACGRACGSPRPRRARAAGSRTARTISSAASDRLIQARSRSDPAGWRGSWSGPRSPPRAMQRREPVGRRVRMAQAAADRARGCGRRGRRCPRRPRRQDAQRRYPGCARPRSPRGWWRHRASRPSAAVLRAVQGRKPVERHEHSRVAQRPAGSASAPSDWPPAMARGQSSASKAAGYAGGRRVRGASDGERGRGFIGAAARPSRPRPRAGR